jgi:hypothetical protein
VPNCIRCETPLVEGVHLVNPLAGGSLAAVVVKDPDAVFMRGQVSSEIRARVCAKCGYLELHATQPGKLETAARERDGE